MSFVIFLRLELKVNTDLIRILLTPILILSIKTFTNCLESEKSDSSRLSEESRAKTMSAGPMHSETKVINELGQTSLLTSFFLL